MRDWGLGDKTKHHASSITHHLSPTQAHLDSAYAYDVAFFQAGGIANLDLVHKCTIGAMQIFQHPNIALQFQACVLRREKRVVQRNFAILHTAANDIARPQWKDLAGRHAALPSAQNHQLAIWAFGSAIAGWLATQA